MRCGKGGTACAHFTLGVRHGGALTSRRGQWRDIRKALSRLVFRRRCGCWADANHPTGVTAAVMAVSTRARGRCLDGAPVAVAAATAAVSVAACAAAAASSAAGCAAVQSPWLFSRGRRLLGWTVCREEFLFPSRHLPPQWKWRLRRPPLLLPPPLPPTVPPPTSRGRCLPRRAVATHDGRRAMADTAGGSADRWAGVVVAAAAPGPVPMPLGSVGVQRAADVGSARRSREVSAGDSLPGTPPPQSRPTQRCVVRGGGGGSSVVRGGGGTGKNWSSVTLVPTSAAVAGEWVGGGGCLGGGLRRCGRRGRRCWRLLRLLRR